MLIRRTPNMLDRVFEDWNRSLGSMTNNSLALDVHETDDAYTITTDIPGMDPENIDVRLHDNVLTISAENTQEHSEKDDEGNVLVQERRYGKFSRSMRFPVNVQDDAVEADYDNGVLTINIPKAEEVKPRRITVNSDRNNGNRNNS